MRNFSFEPENFVFILCLSYQVRAANMNHCSLAAAYAIGEASAFAVKERHQVGAKEVLMFSPEN